jgi:hypothetical protein
MLTKMGWAKFWVIFYKNVFGHPDMRLHRKQEWKMFGTSCRYPWKHTFLILSQTDLDFASRLKTNVCFRTSQIVYLPTSCTYVALQAYAHCGTTFWSLINYLDSISPCKNFSKSNFTHCAVKIDVFMFQSTQKGLPDIGTNLSKKCQFCSKKWYKFSK